MCSRTTVFRKNPFGPADEPEGAPVGGEQFTVHPQALTEFQNSSGDHGDTFNKIVQQLEAARVGRESFGRMPGSGEIFSQYEDRVNACLESLKECATAMRDIGELVQACATDYQDNDKQAGDQFQQISQAMPGGAG
jgi:uncharacterized protein YukE